jgi:hypothetical protein
MSAKVAGSESASAMIGSDQQPNTAGRPWLEYWLTEAAQLPGKSLHLALALWFTASAEQARQMELGNLASRKFGLERNAKYRALQWLEEASLVRVERRMGRSPLVTILGRRAGP